MSAKIIETNKLHESLSSVENSHKDMKANRKTLFKHGGKIVDCFSGIGPKSYT